MHKLLSSFSLAPQLLPVLMVQARAPSPPWRMINDPPPETMRPRVRVSRYSIYRTVALVGGFFVIINYGGP